MLKVNLGGCESFVKKADYEKYVEKALHAFDVLEAETGAGNDFLGWKHLPTNTPESLISDCEAIRDAWKSKGVNLVIVIGIGGSYLGAKCAVEALSHTFAKQLVSAKDSMEVVFAGQNLSEEYLSELMDLAGERNIAAVVISKSGTTTEPAVAFRQIKNYIEEKYGKAEAAERIVAVTDAKKGALKSLSTQEGYKTFVIEDNVGGRFSVLTPVGILPIILAGFDMRKMLAGAAEMEKATAVRSAENPAVQYAAMRNLLYDGGKKVEILVSYNPKLQYLGEWWKQLFGESEGKDGKGIFPASVNFTTDLHSMGQYIQDGERILMETVVSVENSNPSESRRTQFLDRQTLGALQRNGRTRHQTRPHRWRRTSAVRVHRKNRRVQPRLPVLLLREIMRNQRIHPRSESVQPAWRGSLQEEHVGTSRQAWL